jgi:anti-sigma regulatory factor (Ser/Thr protein kinase)
VAVEEVVVNVLRHAYGPGSEETFQVRFISGEGGMTVRVTDHGRPFDFRRERSRYDGRASAGQPVGGIGLHLVHAFMDEVNYEPDTEEGNVMILFKARRPGKASG